MPISPGGTSLPFVRGRPFAQPPFARVPRNFWPPFGIGVVRGVGLLASEPDRPDPSARFTVETGPWYDIRFEGGSFRGSALAGRSPRVLADWTGPRRRGRGAVLKGTTGRPGILSREVSARADPVDGPARGIVFQVDLGPRPRVVDVRISGARGIGPEEILPPSLGPKGSVARAASSIRAVSKRTRRRFGLSIDRVGSCRPRSAFRPSTCRRTAPPCRSSSRSGKASRRSCDRSI